MNFKNLIKRFCYVAALISPVVSVALLSGCASIAHGTRQEETFNSVPTAAEIKVDHFPYGKTPRKIFLSRSDSHNVNISLPGYQPADFVLTKKVSGWFFGNFLLGGVLGVIIDASDGAMYNLAPNQLSTVTGGSIQKDPKKSNTLTIVLAKNTSKSMRDHKIAQLKRA